MCLTYHGDVAEGRLAAAGLLAALSLGLEPVLGLAVLTALLGLCLEAAVLGLRLDDGLLASVVLELSGGRGDEGLRGQELVTASRVLIPGGGLVARATVIT